VVPWIQAFIWAFKPTDIVDIRRFPAAEAKAIEEDIARLADSPKTPKAKTGEKKAAESKTESKASPEPPASGESDKQS